MKIVRVAVCQMNSAVGDFKGNTLKIAAAARNAAAYKCDVILFPEMAVCGYPPEDLLLKKYFISESKKQTENLAKRIAKDIVAVVGFADSDRHSNIYNAAAVICNGKTAGVYRKMRLPNYGVFDEKRYFKPGARNMAFRCGDFSFGISICEDIWNGAGIPVEQHRAGSDIHFNISASPYHAGKLNIRRQLINKTAKQAKTPVCYCNMVGGQDELVFDGGSMAADTGGKILTFCPQFEEALSVCDVPVKKRTEKIANSNVSVVKLDYCLQINRPPAPKAKTFTLMKPDEEIYEALVLGTRDYIRKNGFKKAVLGLSGGIDSALTASIACDALGPENVLGITMPTRFTSSITNSASKILAQRLGMNFLAIPIEPVFKQYLSILKPHFSGGSFGTAEENIQARIRGNILMAFSNKYGYITLTTGNKSESSVGYCTLYGDMAGGLAVIKDVPKTLVYKLAEYRNTISDVIPKSIINRIPTAELRAGQKDTDSLPEYPLLDKILKMYIEDEKEISAIISSGVSKRAALEVINMVDRSEYKRRQSPPGIRITQKAFGRDRRMPITNMFKLF